MSSLLRLILFVTILAFSVIIPFAVGVWFWKSTPTAVRFLTILCGVWTASEIYCEILSVNHINNGHVSFILTACEIFLFTMFYYLTCEHRLKQAVAQFFIIVGVIIVILEYIITSSQFSTISITFEYIGVTFASLFLYYQIVTYKAKPQYFNINLTILFYLLSSFPYFFAWEWLRVSNMQLLIWLANIYSVMHAICYLVLAFQIWKSSLSSSVQH